MPPIYQYQCACGHQEDAFRTIEERNDSPAHCGKKMMKVITKPMIQVDLPEYVSPASGKLIRGRKQRQDDFKRTRTRPWEGRKAEMLEAQKIRDADEAKLDATIERGAYEVLSNMDAAKQKLVKSAG